MRRKAIQSAVEGTQQVPEELKTFETGATRIPIPLHFHYICPTMLRGLAAICAEGFKSYPDKTVPYAELSTGRLGLPLANLIKHKGNHETLWLSGDRSEDHVSKVIWAWMMIYHQEHDCQHFEMLLKPEDRRKEQRRKGKRS